MNNYILLTEKNWHNSLFDKLNTRPNEVWYRISQKEDFTHENIERYKPTKIFIPHWSYIIPSDIFSKYECIVFHMTDLPYGRGGSPLQNLIVNGKQNTKISAIRIDKGIDEGPVYLKTNLSLLGTAEEIFIRSAVNIHNMINKIIDNNHIPQLQEGEIVKFKRRKSHESDISNLNEIEQIFDHIRMLDAEGYPKAYFDLNNFRFEFSRASLKSNEIIIADVKIFRK